MTIICVVIYNRFDNLKRWLDCWQQCQHDDAQLVIIHNYYSDEKEKEKYQAYCEAHHATYVPRNGPGADVGAYQDVVCERLGGFPNDWHYLLWCTDDCLPMARNFYDPFVLKLQEPSVGVACMQISRSNPGGVWHVRTTGFCITKELSRRLEWKTPHVKNKQDCYDFEHKGGKFTLSEQVRAMGLDCVQVDEVRHSPLWDSQHPNLSLRLDRWAEFNQVWGIIERTPKVLFICPVYNMYPQIITSLLCQKHHNWELLLIHNGPLNDHVYEIPDDKRIKFIVHPVATGKWGHLLRQKYLNEIRARDDVDYVVVTNADNYYSPAFCASLLTGFKKPYVVAAYCEDMVHSYTGWGVLKVRLQRGYIDCGGVMVRKDVACDVGWRDIDGHSSDWTYIQDIQRKHTTRGFQAVPGCHFVHN